MSDSLQPHELQHARPPCPSPTPGVHSDLRPSSQWCHPTISSSVVPFSSARLEEAEAGIKIARRNINHLRYADNTTLMAESKEVLKSLLMKVKQESEKASLKFNIQLSKIMASAPITSWQIDGETMETRTGFFSWSLKSLQMVIIAIKLKDPCSLNEKLW